MRNEHRETKLETASDQGVNDFIDIHGLPFHPTVVYHQSTFRFWHGNVKRRYG